MFYQVRAPEKPREISSGAAASNNEFGNTVQALRKTLILTCMITDCSLQCIFYLKKVK